MKTILHFVLLFSALGRARGSSPCEVCGCSYCTPGEYFMGNPGGVLEYTEAFRNLLNDTTVGDGTDEEQISCARLEEDLRRGNILEESCERLVQWNPTVRETCGCGDLPSHPEETVPAQPVECELCGCSYCAPGEYPMGNPGGIINMKDAIQLFGNETEQGQSLAETLEDSGLWFIPCGLLDFSAKKGDFGDLCVNDELWTHPLFRDTCGCPSLPPRPPGVPAPSWATSVPIPTPQVPTSPPLRDQSKFTLSTTTLLRWVGTIVLFLLLAIGILSMKTWGQTSGLRSDVKAKTLEEPGPQVDGFPKAI